MLKKYLHRLIRQNLGVVHYTKYMIKYIFFVVKNLGSFNTQIYTEITIIG